MQAIDQNQLRTARERLTSLLTTNPSLSRARLELARVYYLSQDYTKAREEAQRVLTTRTRRRRCGRRYWPFWRRSTPTRSGTWRAISGRRPSMPD